MLPGGATVAVILPFGVAILATVLFSFFYVRRYRHTSDSDVNVLVTTIVAMTVTLLTSALLPVDIFIVSYMKNSDGSFKEWAANLTSRNDIENAVLYSYYALYGLIFLCIFVVIPFMYFFYEEKSEDGFESNDRLWSALKFTLIFVLVAGILLLIGAFIPLKEAPEFSNSTSWDRIEFLINDLGKNRGQDALSMVLNILSVLGMLNVIFFTGYGVSSWPVGLIRGTKSAKAQFEEIQDNHLINQTRINALRDKERIGKRLSNRERRQLVELEETERLITREEHHLAGYRGSLVYKCRRIIRPIQIAFGICAGGFALLIWISLLLTNIDRAMHSLGMQMGYTLPNSTLPNPLDFVLVNFQKVFPLDYIMILLLSFFLVMATISGIRNLGLWLLCMRMYKLRPKRTRPQGLLIFCVTLMLTVLGFNILTYCIVPQYTTFGSQKYYNATDPPTFNQTSETWPCSASAKPEDCTMTRASSLLIRYFYKMWYFGAFYYWASWAFVGVSLLACLHVIFRRSRTATDGLVDPDELEESDDELIRP